MSHGPTNRYRGICAPPLAARPSLDGEAADAQSPVDPWFCKFDAIFHENHAVAHARHELCIAALHLARDYILYCFSHRVSSDVHIQLDCGSHHPTASLKKKSLISLTLFLYDAGFPIRPAFEAETQARDNHSQTCQPMDFHNFRILNQPIHHFAVAFRTHHGILSAPAPTLNHGFLACKKTTE